MRHHQLMVQRRFKPSRPITSRRQAKSHATGVGQHLKGGRITHEVNLETIFNHPAWKHLK